MPSVLFLNRSYYPDAEATGQLLTQLCEDLARDFEIRVLAGQPNQNPAGADYRRSGVEVRNGVAIRRVRHTQFHKASAIGRLANWFSFLLSVCWASLFGSRPDAVVVETDPPLLCLLGGLLKRRYGCRLVVYLQDIYPDVGVAIGKLREGLMVRVLRGLFRRVYRRADRLVVLSADMRQTLIDWGIDASKIQIIPNWIDTTSIRPVKQENTFRERHGLLSEFVAMYSGNMGLCQRLDVVLDAAERLRHRQDVVFLLVGDGASRSRLEQRVRADGMPNVRFLDYQPAESLSESLSAADIHLLPLDPRVAGCLMPSKFYGILASGTVVLAIAPSACELARIVEAERVGYVIAPDQPAALAECIAGIADRPEQLEDMAHRARHLATERFDRKHSVAAFANLLTHLTISKSSQPAESKSELAEARG